MFFTMYAITIASAHANANAGWPETHSMSEKAGWFWSAGNHRFVIEATSGGAAVATVNWRRHDTQPEKKDAFIVDAHTHLRVPACLREDGANGTASTFTFAASSGPGAYHLYFMPFTTCEFTGGNCPFGANSVYVPRTSCADNMASFGTPHEAISVIRQSRYACMQLLADSCRRTRSPCYILRELR
jgi:hypothetical protein